MQKVPADFIYVPFLLHKISALVADIVALDYFECQVG